MQEIPFILTEWQELNSLLYTPLNATKRIQYTCIDVSMNYIILGTTSGSAYLFGREPCVFQQLIPLSEGAVNQAQISPDEKTIALSTIRGSVCLITLKPTIKLMTVSTEHVGEKVTCLCWNDNSTEVYAGDELGRISVSIISSFKVNGMFQSPSCTLMNLDSKIIQMNFTSSLLLVSTLNRCYICDTVQEQYKQIGNKPRVGEFGACFFNTNNQDDKALAETRDLSNVKHVFSASAEASNGISNEDRSYLPKIYCARPGSRLWEVNSNGVVSKTHQFKEALAIAPIPVYKPSIGKLFKLKKNDELWPAQSINFAQLFVISHKYLFSYTLSGLYILDPENAEVILWNDEFPDIFMVHIVNDKIYLMTFSGVFHCLTLTSIDYLILKLYDKKLYKECLEMCQILRPQLMNSIAESCDIDIKENADISMILAPIISLIKSNQNTQPIKLKSGIVIVNTGNRDSDSDSILSSERNCVESKNLDGLEDLLSSLNTNGTSDKTPALTEAKILNIDFTDSTIKNGVCHEQKENEQENKSNKISSLQLTISNLQTDLESLYLSMSSQMKPDMTEKELEEVINLFVETLNDVKLKYEVSSELQNYLYEVIRSAELHYSNNLLENLPIELLHKVNNQKCIKQIVKIFTDINIVNYIECSCGFSYPLFDNDTNKSVEPKFLEMGKVLLNKLIGTESDSMCLKMCNQVPYMWRDYLSLKGYTKEKIPDNLLKQCLQTQDSLVLSAILTTICKEQWKIVKQCFESIKNGRCTNCGKPYDSDKFISKEFTTDWYTITNIIIKKHGPSNAMMFLSKVHENLPQIFFDKSVYQSIIFSTILNHHGVKHAIELNHSNVEHNSICSPKILEDVVQAVEKDMGEPMNKNLFGSGPHHWGMRYNLTSSTCPCCTLSLQTPVLLGNNGIALFPCGHAYHVNCMIQKKISRCNLHSQ